MAKPLIQGTAAPLQAICQGRKCKEKQIILFVPSWKSLKKKHACVIFTEIYNHNVFKRYV